MIFLSRNLGLVAIMVLFFAANARADDFKLESADVQEGQQLSSKQVANALGCKGGNISPALKWSNPPAGTKSFALSVYDPDAPTGSGWWHWVVYNIPASILALDENAGSGDSKLPKGAVQVRNDEGKKEFGGACPPVGDKPHHYIFTIYALNVDSLKLPPDASPAMAGFMINKSTIGKSTITAVYSRDQ